MNNKDLTNSLEKLSGWIDNNGWNGIDHYDIMDNSIFRLLNKRRFTFYFEIALLDLFPELLVKQFRVRKKINAKAIALLCEGYCNQFSTTKNDVFLNKAIECADWLLANNSPGYPNMCWGYPFNWDSNQLLKAGTPSGVVTSHVVSALLRVYDNTSNNKYLEACVSACEFFEKQLNIIPISKDEICYSYTPFDKEICYNASILVAASIYKTSTRDNRVSTEYSSKALNFVLKNQMLDGSWHYLYPNDGRIDPYHSGFIIRSLYDIYLIKKREDIQFSIKKGIDYFINYLLVDKTIPVYRVGRKYPIDIHSCAEAIIMFSTLSELNIEYLEVAKRVARWTIQNMQDKEGFFYYRKYPTHLVKIAYFRWAQAWMFLALSRLNNYIFKNNNM